MYCCRLFLRNTVKICLEINAQNYTLWISYVMSRTLLVMNLMMWS